MSHASHYLCPTAVSNRPSHHNISISIPAKSIYTYGSKFFGILASDQASIFQRNQLINQYLSGQLDIIRAYYDHSRSTSECVDAFARSQKMIRNDNMKMAITPVIWMLLAMFAAPLPADARSLPNKAAMVQLERGLAAFNRHDYAVAGLLLKTPAERGNSRAQAILCFLNAYGRGVPQNFRESAIWSGRSSARCPLR